MKSEYRPALDGVRAICILLTLMNHIKGWPGTAPVNFGVDIFFALSGWLITWLLLEGRDRNRKALGGFYIRRFFRIAPMYYLAIALYAAAAFVFHKPNADLLLLTFNPEYRFGEEVLMGHAWTLGIEEKFYILWPALLVFMGGRQWMGWIVASILAVLLMALSGFDSHVIRGYFGLGIGATLALTVKRSPQIHAALSRPYIAEAAALGIIASYLTAVIFNAGWITNLVSSAFAAVMIGSLWLRPSGPLSKGLSIQPLPFLGSLTYAFYLLHVLALSAVEVAAGKAGLSLPPPATLVVAYAASVCLAWPAHVLVEKPAIRLGRDLAKRWTSHRGAAI